jgi:FkbM family methyltransferase
MRLPPLPIGAGVKQREAGRMIGGIASRLLNGYLHALPDFRGKWRLLVPLAGLLDGLPVRSRYAHVKLGLSVLDRTNQLCVLGKYGDTVSSQVEALQHGDCFVDIGANCGLFSLMAAGRVGDDGLVIAFEPCFDTFAKLVQNIELNDVRNVLPFNMAVAELTGPDLLAHPSARHSGRSSIVAETSEEQSGETIRSLALRDFPGLIKLIADRATLIKIDVEGFELAVLRGIVPLLAQGRTRGVVVEIDERNLARYDAKPEAVYALLEEHGFRRSGESEDGVHFDAVFTRGETLPRRPDLSRVATRRMAPECRLPTPRQSKVPWRRIAAASVLLCAGGAAIDSMYFFASRADPREYFIQEALESHKTAELRARLQRSPPTRFDVAEVGSAIRVDFPVLPPSWHILDVQPFPSESGQSMQLTILRGNGAPVWLYAARDEGVAPIQPVVTVRDGLAIASWQEGELAYALIARGSPSNLDKWADDLSDNQPFLRLRPRAHTE